MASIQESEGSIDHVIEAAVQAASAISAARVRPPQKRLRSGARTIAAAASAAPSSVAQISTTVVRPSWRPPSAPKAAAATTAAISTVSAARVPTRGSATALPAGAALTETAGDDTSSRPEDHADDGDRPQDDEHGEQRVGHRAAQ